MLCSVEIMEKAGMDPTPEEITAEEEKFKSMCLLKRSNTNRYSNLVIDLKKGMYVGRDEYPQTTPSTYNLLICHSTLSNQVFRGGGDGDWGRGHRQPGRDSNRRRGGRVTRVVFVQHRCEDCVAGTDGVINVRVICFGCQQPGHIISLCPNAPPGGYPRPQMMQLCCSFAQSGEIPKSWILLDT